MLDREWVTSSYSNNSGGECFEVRMVATGAAIDVRDSQHPGLSQLSFGAGEWRAFLAEVARM